MIDLTLLINWTFSKDRLNENGSLSFSFSLDGKRKRRSYNINSLHQGFSWYKQVRRTKKSLGSKKQRIKSGRLNELRYIASVASSGSPMCCNVHSYACMYVGTAGKLVILFM